MKQENGNETSLQKLLKILLRFITVKWFSVTHTYIILQS